jgi:hypothetical protein
MSFLRVVVVRGLCELPILSHGLCGTVCSGRTGVVFPLLVVVKLASKVKARHWRAYTLSAVFRTRLEAKSTACHCPRLVDATCAVVCALEFARVVSATDVSSCHVVDTPVV